MSETIILARAINECLLKYLKNVKKGIINCQINNLLKMNVNLCAKLLKSPLNTLSNER